MCIRDSIQAIAAVHNLLCRQDIGITTVDAVAQQLIESARVSLVSPEQPITFEVLGDMAIVGSHEATILAIVLNELLNNAIVHGIPHIGGTIIIDTKIEDGIVTVEVRDNGPSYKNENISTTKSGLGLQIIQTLVSNDLEGKFELSNDCLLYTSLHTTRCKPALKSSFLIGWRLHQHPASILQSPCWS